MENSKSASRVALENPLLVGRHRVPQEELQLQTTSLLELSPMDSGKWQPSFLLDASREVAKCRLLVAYMCVEVFYQREMLAADGEMKEHLHAELEKRTDQLQEHIETGASELYKLVTSGDVDGTLDFVVYLQARTEALMVFRLRFLRFVQDGCV